MLQSALVRFSGCIVGAVIDHLVYSTSDVDATVTDLADRLGSDVQVDLQWTPRERVVVSSG